MSIKQLTFLALACMAAGTALAKELLNGVVEMDGEKLTFSLTGEDRENVVGGTIKLGERVFKITKVSRLGLIGAARVVIDESEQKHYGEFATFSSSFSEQTAKGKPWVASKRYVDCDRPYNSFLAIYMLVGKDALEALGSVPYSALNEDINAADESTVYCFTSHPL